MRCRRPGLGHIFLAVKASERRPVRPTSPPLICGRKPDSRTDGQRLSFRVTWPPFDINEDEELTAIVDRHGIIGADNASVVVEDRTTHAELLSFFS